MKCPKCKATIDCFINHQSGVNVYYFDKDGRSDEEFIADRKQDDFKCPRCRLTITTSEERAVRILREG